MSYLVSRGYKMVLRFSDAKMAWNFQGKLISVTTAPDYQILKEPDRLITKYYSCKSVGNLLLYYTN